MRISTSQIQLSGLNKMLDQQAKLLMTQQQIATGKRIINPSDDPAGITNIMGLQQSLKSTEQYQENIDIARARLSLEENILGGVGNSLNRIRELSVQGNTATLVNEDRITLATEIRQQLDELLNLSNSQDANGEYLFSGFQGKTQPFSVSASGDYGYNGDEGQRFLQIGSNRQIAETDSGTDVFRAIRNGNGTFTTFDNQSNTGSGVIDPGSVTNPALIDGDSYNLSFFAATTATGTLTYGDDLTTADNLGYTLQINGTTVYTTNEADPAPVNSLAGLAAEINNDVGTTGVRAYVDGGALYLTNTSPTATPITISEAMSGASDGDLDGLTGYFGSNLTGTTTPSRVTTLNNAADFYLVEDSAGNVETSGSYMDGGSIAFNGLQTNVRGTPNVGDTISISPSRNQDIFHTVRDLADAMENIGTNTPADLARLNNAVNRFFVAVDSGMVNLNQIRAQVGARLNALDSQEGLNEDFMLELKSTISEVEDLDYAEAITRLTQQQTALEAAQQSYIRIQGLSLFNSL